MAIDQLVARVAAAALGWQGHEGRMPLGVRRRSLRPSEPPRTCGNGPPECGDDERACSCRSSKSMAHHKRVATAQRDGALHGERRKRRAAVCAHVASSVVWHVARVEFMSVCLPPLASFHAALDKVGPCVGRTDARAGKQWRDEHEHRVYRYLRALLGVVQMVVPVHVEIPAVYAHH